MTFSVFNFDQSNLEIEFYTKRLRFRSQVLEDEEKLDRLSSDEESMRVYYEKWDRLGSFQKIQLLRRDFCAQKRIEESQLLEPYTALAVEDFIEDVFIGQVALEKEGGMESAWLSYIVDSAYRSKGYGFEIASAMVGYYVPELKKNFPEREVKELKAQIDATNLASLRIVQKLGMNLLERRGERVYYTLRV